MNRTHRPGGPGQDLPAVDGPAERQRTEGCRARRGLARAVAGVALFLVVAGCSAATTAAGPATAPAPVASGAAAPASGVPDPNAPEVIAAGDIPDNQVFVPVRPAGAPFSVAVPQGWVQSRDGVATVFTDKFNSVRIETRPLAAAPDVTSVRSQDVVQLQGSPGFVLGEVKAVQRQAGTGVLMTYTAASPVNAVTGKSVTEAVERYVFWRSGQEAVLTLSGPRGSDNVDPWRKISDSLRWQ